jgi:hypothetical protein
LRTEAPIGVTGLALTKLSMPARLAFVSRPKC